MLNKFSKYARSALSVMTVCVCAHGQPAGIAAQAITVPTVPIPEKEVRSITLSVGEQTSISAVGVKSYSEGLPGIVDVRLPKDGTQFVLVALRPGDTTLLTIMADGKQIQYRIRVGGKTEKGVSVQAVDNIRLDFYFVQLSRSYGHQIGVGWPGAIGGNLNLTAAFDLKAGALQSATAVVANQALPRLDIAQSTGWARLMRQAAVITANGNEATFSSGGETNYQITNGFVAEIRKIEFGSTVSVLPRFDTETGRIEITLKAEVSDLTQSTGTPIPGRTRSNVETIINLELGQSLVLGGLTSATDAHEQSGLPGLSQIPILGLLFGSNTKKSDDVENLIFIVPTVVDAVPLQVRNRVAEALEIYSNFSGSLDRSTRLMGQPDPKSRKVSAYPKR